MIDKKQLEDLIRTHLDGTGYELITLTMNAEQEILVEVDRLEGVDLEYCAELNHYLVEQLEAQGEEDYSLEVGSVSLTDPFRTKMQYMKHLGHPVEVLASDGLKWRGELVSVDEETFSVDVEMMKQVEGKKRRQKVVETMTFPYMGIKYARYDLKF